ncbi:flagellar basal body rod protein [Maricaulis sp. W15]|uniref:Flagellar basal body rod protein FlgB n=1 Tax=Maricaulis maris TaxID=74318 RepID=A0A495DCZ8_9PROT|nr:MULTISPECIES: flagellar basal body rod protein FlgB [Maricaulis]OLF74058.1 flagellar basal body rod protein [Maricaulis sp. W15]RKR00143.1 flagellar basal-body rod protein FlgB [Maricaulis maris]
MRPDDVPVLALLRQSMSFHADRQQVIAENIANANTPGYTPRDLDESDFHAALRSQMSGGSSAPRGAVGLTTTNAGHIPASSTGAGASENWEPVDSPDSETTVNGNSVVLEEQMVRAQENRMRYESALTLYQKSLGLLRTAIRAPGR